MSKTVLDLIASDLFTVYATTIFLSVTDDTQSPSGPRTHYSDRIIMLMMGGSGEMFIGRSWLFMKYKLHQ